MLVAEELEAVCSVLGVLTAAELDDVDTAFVVVVAVAVGAVPAVFTAMLDSLGWYIEFTHFMALAPGAGMTAL